MNLVNNENIKYFAYLALFTIFLAVLAKFDGTVSVQVTPLGLEVQVRSHSSGCRVYPELPQIQPNLLDPELA